MVAFKDRPLGFVVWNPRRKNSGGWVEDAKTGCHIWLGGRSSDGYALARHEGRKVVVVRVRYEREVGHIPNGLILDHYKCNNGGGGCCNPYHCRPATRRENTLRGDTMAAMWLARTHCRRGHEFTVRNTRIEKQTGARTCRRCDRDRSRIRQGYKGLP